MMVSHGLKLKEVESCTLGSTVVVVEQAERRRRRTPRRFVSVWCATTLRATVTMYTTQPTTSGCNCTSFSTGLCARALSQ